MIGQIDFKSATLNQQYKGGVQLILELSEHSIPESRMICDGIQSDKVYTAKIDRKRRSRTLDQNAYLWVLCQRIAEATRADKEEVYRTYIMQKGQFDILCIQDKAVDRFCRNWSDKGIGWFCLVDSSRIPRCKNVFCYYGTSVYNTAEMTAVLDEVIRDCKEMNISTYAEGYKEELYAE